MKKVAFVAVALALVLLRTGIVIGYFVVPYLMPKERIKENLYEENIPFHESEWYEGMLVVAESVQQFPDFQQFVYAYE
jgi:predicted molibdopterin-dependent oxidoreductase YjgC